MSLHGHCCSAASVPDPGTSTCHRCNQNKMEKKVFRFLLHPSISREQLPLTTHIHSLSHSFTHPSHCPSIHSFTHSATHRLLCVRVTPSSLTRAPSPLRPPHLPCSLGSTELLPEGQIPAPPVPSLADCDLEQVT